MSWEMFGYAGVCVAVPVAWGLGVYWVSGLIERRVLRNHLSTHENGSEEPTLPLDYHI